VSGLLPVQNRPETWDAGNPCGPPAWHWARLSSAASSGCPGAALFATWRYPAIILGFLPLH
jgi:hypothetical protein